MADADARPRPVGRRWIDGLDVRVYADRAALGAAAAVDVAAAMRAVLTVHGRVRMAFAAAPSQEAFLGALAGTAELDWSRVTAFQLDEYLGLPVTDPRRFGQFLRTRLFDQVRPGVVHRIDAPASGNEVTAECRRYAALIGAEPLDIVCFGIGENGHLAFNDPPIADFEDPELVKLVELDAACRQQQVNDGCFAALDLVPTQAITLTIPTLISGRRLVGMVPGATKRAAVQRTLFGPVTTACPASILRTHPACTLYLDPESYGQ